MFDGSVWNGHSNCAYTFNWNNTFPTTPAIRNGAMTQIDLSPSTPAPATVGDSATGFSTPSTCTCSTTGAADRHRDAIEPRAVRSPLAAAVGCHAARRGRAPRPNITYGRSLGGTDAISRLGDAEILSASHPVARCLAQLAAAPKPSGADEPPKSALVAPVRLDSEAVPYPDGAQGDATVVLELEIEQDGRVGTATVREGHAPFDNAARTAAIEWRFAPATRNGLPVRARVLAKVSFRAPQPVEARPAADSRPEGDEKAAAAPMPVVEPPPVEVSVVGEAREELGSTRIPRNETRLIPARLPIRFGWSKCFPELRPS